MADNSSASVSKVIRYFRQNGVADTLSRGSTAIAYRVLGKALRKRIQPTYGEFQRARGRFSAADLLRENLHITADADKAWSAEYDAVHEELLRRHSEHSLSYGENWGIDPEAGLLVYCIIRALRPTTVVETGVANGDSSFLILSALAANDHGMLHSVEVDPNAGVILRQDERRRWKLHVLEGTNYRAQFRRIMGSIGKIDVFMHDSDHWYDWHLFELETAYSFLNAGGVVLSDDIADSAAFFDFCRNRKLSPTVLLARRPFGAVFSGSADAIHHA